MKSPVRLYRVERQKPMACIARIAIEIFFDFSEMIHASNRALEDNCMRLKLPRIDGVSVRSRVVRSRIALIQSRCLASIDVTEDARQHWR